MIRSHLGEPDFKRKVLIAASPVAGDAPGLRAFANAVSGRRPAGAYDANGLDTRLSVTCVDPSLPRTVAAFESLTAETMAFAPRTGAYYLSLGYPCSFRPASPGRDPHRQPAVTGRPCSWLAARSTRRTPTSRCSASPVY